MSYMWLSTLEICAAQHLVALQKRAEITVLMGEQNPIRYGFRAGEKAIRHRVNTFPMWLFTLQIGGAQFCSDTEIPVLEWEQKPCPVRFSCRRKKISAMVWTQP